jgi:hypothetical protein
MRTELSPPSKWLHTCSLITGEPNEFVREIPTRRPVILSEGYHEIYTVKSERILHPISGALNEGVANDARVISFKTMLPETISTDRIK